MKRTLIITLLCMLTASWTFAQDLFSVPELTQQNKQEVLYNHVIAYAVTGINFAKSQGVSPYDYGVHVGKLFTSFWNPEQGLPALGNGLIYILAGLHPDNEMEILFQN